MLFFRVKLGAFASLATIFCTSSIFASERGTADFTKLLIACAVNIEELSQDGLLWCQVVLNSDNDPQNTLRKCAERHVASGSTYHAVYQESKPDYRKSKKLGNILYYRIGHEGKTKLTFEIHGPYMVGSDPVIKFNRLIKRYVEICSE
ncbi:MAG: hypothetical protein K2X39_05145 [Silvanigrellaceae bacterium]|nr:hypothetical protein [Silvanigrellaceae bacterium]